MMNCVYDDVDDVKNIAHKLLYQQQLHHVYTHTQNTMVIEWWCSSSSTNEKIDLSLCGYTTCTLILSRHNNGRHVLTRFIRGVDVSNRSRGRCNVTKKNRSTVNALIVCSQFFQCVFWVIRSILFDTEFFNLLVRYARHFHTWFDTCSWYMCVRARKKERYGTYP